MGVYSKYDNYTANKRECNAEFVDEGELTNARVSEIFEGKFYDTVNVKISENITSIGYRAFYFLWGLKHIEIPSSVKKIESSAFDYCPHLESVKLNEGLEFIDGYAFSSCKKLKSIEIPRSVAELSECAFAYCDSLASITVNEKNRVYESIDGNLYTKGGETLIQYAIGKNDKTFVVPNGVKTIGFRAFLDCKALERIVIPKSVTCIGDFAFELCNNLECITVDAGNKAYKSIDGNLYTKGGDVLIRYAVAKKDKSFDVPSHVKTIGVEAFSYCENLEVVNLYDGIFAIEEGAFKNCTALKKVKIPQSVITIGYWAFFGNRKLTIYCEAEACPKTWNKNWSGNRRPVIWGDK